MRANDAGMKFRNLPWAAVFDLSQRLITANRAELRTMLRGHVRSLNVPRGGAVLDFGCGTGLYAGMLMNEGLRYHGYDIDTKFLDYASRLHPRGRFDSEWARVQAGGPFDLVMANCCFHHINDQDGAPAIERIASVLKPGGAFLFVDHIPPTQPRVSLLRRAFRRLERGYHIRVTADYVRLIEPWLKVESIGTERSHVLSIGSPLNPFFNELVVLKSRRCS